MSREKYILKNLIKKQSFENFHDLFDFLDNEEAIVNLDTLDVLLSDILEQFKNQVSDYELFIQYQILINKIVNNPNFESTYNENAKIISLLEMVRIITLIFKESSLKFFSGCYNVRVKIVEVNKNGLKIKHFAYGKDYNIGDLVYISTPRPANFYLVSDFYEVKLKDLLRYIINISSECVYNFDTSYDVIAKYNLTEIQDEHVVRVAIGDVEILARTRYNHYITEPVKLVVEDGFKTGYILGDVFFGKRKPKPFVFKILEREKKKFYKERRHIDDNVVKYLFDGWSLDSLKETLQNMNRKKYVVIFSVLERLFYLLDDNKERNLNEIEEINLYFRPYLNFLLDEVDINKFYYHNNGICFSILHYLILYKITNYNSLDFLLDKNYDYNINLVDINIYGKIKTCFAYDNKYIIGEPVFIQLEDVYPIGFVHNVRTLTFSEVIQNIEYFLSPEIVRINKLKEIVEKRSTFDNKVILVKVYDGKDQIIAISDNYVPYVGESVRLMVNMQSL